MSSFLVSRGNLSTITKPFYRLVKVPINIRVVANNNNNNINRIRELFIARNHWPWVFEYSGPLVRFFRSKLVPCKHSVRECVKISRNRTKQEWYVSPINFYKTRIKDPVIIKRIRSSSNLLIFLVSCWQHTWPSYIWYFLCSLSYLRG